MKRKSINKRIAFIIAAAVAIGQIPVSALAYVNDTIQADSVEVTNDSFAYDQDYSNFDSNSWTRLIGEGEIKEVFDFADGDSKGALTIKRGAANNNLVFVEDQSPELKDFEAETRFKLSPESGANAGRFGLVFRGKNASTYGFVGYNIDTGWLIESPSAWKDDIVGPKIEADQWVTMKVTLQRNNLILVINGQEIFNGNISLDNFPQEAGKFGFRTWYDNKNVTVDYLKIKSLDNVISNDIKSVDPINIETLAKSKPELPYKVNVIYEDDTKGEEVVIWDYIDPNNYANSGTFTVQGKIKGAAETVPKAVANVTVREISSYESNFDSVETSGDWKVLKPTGVISTIQDGKIKIPMNGVSLAYDNKSPNVKNFTYETEFSVDSDGGRIGLGFRVADVNNWGAICYDSGSWVWKAAKNGQESYGAFPGSIKIEANKTYKMKLRAENNIITLFINDEVLGSVTTDGIPNGAGKIGLVGWFGNKTVTLDNVKVQEIVPETEGDLPEVQIQSIESDTIKVNLDNTFPRILDYTWKDDNSKLTGQENRFNKVRINNTNYSPEVKFSVENNIATYTLYIKEIEVTLTIKISVNDNKIRMEVTDIKEAGTFKIKKLSLPNNSFATVNSNEGGAIAGVLSTGAWHKITDEISTVEDLEPSLKSKTYAFINDNKFAITMNNNVLEYSSRITLNTENKNGYKSTAMGTGEWTYREVLEAETELFAEKTLWSEVMITKDMNSDNEIDWQDAAIEYRNEVESPMGGDMIKDSFSYIAFNIGYTQSPFLRTLDTVKKLSNYTDGFGQMVLEKGYQAEGHDDAIPDYGGHIGIRQGGVEDFNTLINEGAKYNAKFGVHINATEYQLDAFSYPDGIVNEKAPGWGWLDQAYYVDQRADIITGELFNRLDSLKKDVPNLGWVYVDVYTGNGWNAHQLGEKLNSLGYPVATEFHSPLEEHVIWNHWGSDPAYPNQGGTSEILRFIRNSTKDGFLSNSLLKGSKHLLSSGWGNNHAIEGVNGVERFYNQVLPTKYMQHFDIMKMTEDEVIFNEGLRAVREGANINYYKAGRLVATTPENTINNIGEGKTTLFLPWNPVEEDEKIYHWNPLGTSSEWTLPEGWSNLKTVELYEVSDLGRTKVKSVNVVNEKVTLDVKQNTPYIVTKGEVAEARIDSWGEGSLIVDPGFDSQSFNSWQKESLEENTDHITFVNETENRRKGNDVVSIGVKQGKVSQEITGLEEGETYTLSAWVKNSGNREVTLGVNIGDENLNNVITRGGRVRQGEGVKWLDDTHVRMEVEFTVPEGIDKANIYIEAKEGSTPVLIDDFRIWNNPGNTNRDGYVFYEDFENVDEGITPFFLAPGRGTSNRTHLAEKDLYGRQKMNWVLDGRFSLKSNQQAGEVGEMIVTDSSTLKLKPNTKYELGFLYSLVDAAPGYSINIKSISNGTLLNLPLEATGVEAGKYTNSKSLVKEFTTGNVDDYYISLDKKNGFKELILDNIYITEIKEESNSTIKNVNLNVSINDLPVNIYSDFNVNALMSNGKKVDLSKAKVEYIISDDSVILIEDGKIKGLKDGISTLSAKVEVDGKTVTSNVVNIKVGNGGEVEEVLDKTELNKLIEDAEALNKEEYTEESWENLAKALEAAKAISSKEDVTQEEVNEIKASLNKAIEELEKIDDEGSIEVDKTELSKSIEDAEALKEEDYTKGSWENFAKVLVEAKVILDKEETTQEEVNSIKSSLNKAIEELEKVDDEEVIEVDKNELNKSITIAEALKEEDYTKESWENFAKVLAEAKVILEKEETTQEEVNNIKSSLDKAIEDLKESDSEKPIEVDKSQLKKLIAGAEALKKEDYTKESWISFEEALKEARSVFNKVDASQEEIDNAKNKIAKAISELKTKNTNNGNSNNNTENNGNISSDNNSSTNIKGSNKSLPETGGTSVAPIGIFGTLVSILGVFMIKRKKVDKK